MEAGLDLTDVIVAIKKGSDQDFQKAYDRYPQISKVFTQSGIEEEFRSHRVLMKYRAMLKRLKSIG